MISALVIVKNPGNDKWEGLGDHEFEILPRVGERILTDIDGIGYVYEVVAIVHPFDPSGSIGDVYAVRIGTITDVNARLFRESPAAE